VPIKAFLPGSIPRDEYIAQKEIPTSLVNDTSGTLSSMPEEGWGMSPVDQQTVSLLESSPLLTKKTWRLRLIRDETGCIPVEREGVRNVADNNLDNTVPLKFLFRSHTGNPFSNFSKVDFSMMPSLT